VDEDSLVSMESLSMAEEVMRVVDIVFEV